MIHKNDEYGLPNFSIIGNQFVVEYTDKLYENYHMTYRKNTKTFEISEGHG